VKQNINLKVPKFHHCPNLEIAKLLAAKNHNSGRNYEDETLMPIGNTRPCSIVHGSYIRHP